ncbi:hypothetical protein PVAP13_9NG515214 [Panicum virgatum]|uniref:Uncharacterized protein n=1 Tax=Panicum virgatum TaxID=38727 RepID=A0A8T0MSB8_PANVG|nr:hypothetical protein PVAP13_9NG515214 [Panicum virgatum]
MLCHCPAGLAEWLTRHWSPLFFLATKTHDLRRRNTAHPPPPELRPPSTAGNPVLHRRPPLPEICPYTTKVRDPVFLAACFPSSSFLRSRRPLRLPCNLLPLLVFLAAVAPSSSSSRPAPPPLLPRGRGPLFIFLAGAAPSSSSSWPQQLLCELDLVRAVARRGAYVLCEFKLNPCAPALCPSLCSM